METKEIIHELRTKNGLSQDELAEKVFVIRQAVSRWENGKNPEVVFIQPFISAETVCYASPFRC